MWMLGLPCPACFPCSFFAAGPGLWWSADLLPSSISPYFGFINPPGIIPPSQHFHDVGNGRLLGGKHSFDGPHPARRFVLLPWLPLFRKNHDNVAFLAFPWRLDTLNLNAFGVAFLLGDAFEGFS